jgi:hypothetical protein
MELDIDSLTIGQAKELVSIFTPQGQSSTLNEFVGEKVIIRTYSAGVWFGVLRQKSGNEVILKNARRMWRWHAKQSISLSGVANYGIKEDESRIAPAVSKVWLEAIEIISCTESAIMSIEGAKNATTK